MQHTFNHRVIYQDTDAGGVVYYANYLGYFERGRTELIRGLGFSLKRLKDEKRIVFAVTRVECDYLSPAYYEDEITIETRVTGAGGATIDFEQKVFRGEKVLVAAKITLIAIDINKFKARRLPPELAEKLPR